ncbi:uncharacterized protein V1516DRAFT_607297, partial [Lipomyces oligophaga]|uniref:uncharacterized protein n=1 Tax=Lipomyces oligophaga TaxID=45792 RepID=UPI0034CEB476
LARILVVRHATRRDSEDVRWRDSSPTPYDPPLSNNGSSNIAQSTSATQSLTVCIHSSPFLRCAMTALRIARQVADSSEQFPLKLNIRIRFDAFLGEWLTPGYYANTSPPPEDGHISLADSSSSWLLSNGGRPFLDLTWPLSACGKSGSYGERWKTMNTRFASGLSNLIASYSSTSSVSSSGSNVIILVTHGAGCNALVSALSRKQLLVDYGLASLSVAVPR